MIPLTDHGLPTYAASAAASSSWSVRAFDNGTLHFRSSRKSMQGRYACRAVNRAGPDLMAIVNVTVNGEQRKAIDLIFLFYFRPSSSSCSYIYSSCFHIFWWNDGFSHKPRTNLRNRPEIGFSVWNFCYDLLLYAAADSILLAIFNYFSKGYATHDLGVRRFKSCHWF